MSQDTLCVIAAFFCGNPKLCALHKNGGVAISRETVQSCAWLAASKVEEIHKLLDGALAGADAKAASERQV